MTNNFDFVLNLDSDGYSEQYVGMQYGSIDGSYTIEEQADINPLVNVSTFVASEFDINVFSGSGLLVDQIDETEGVLSVSLTSFHSGSTLSDELTLNLAPNDIFTASAFEADFMSMQALDSIPTASAGHFTDGYFTSFPIAGWHAIYAEQSIINGVVDIDVPVTDVRIEAEDADTLTNFRGKSRNYFSGGDSINLGKGSQNEVGYASYVFQGVSGNYNFEMLVCDETDGVGTIDVEHTMEGGITYQLASFELDSTQGVGGSKPASFRTLSGGGIYLNTGDTIALTGYENGGEHLVIDYMDFLAV